MKKLLLTLSSVTLVGTAGMSVISCGVKPETDVIFMLPGEAVGSGSPEKIASYQDLVDDFNNLYANKEGYAKIKLKWAKSGTINDAILTGDNLPDLYISYADAVSLYSETKAGDQVRDMAKSMGDGFEDFKNDLITDSYIKEGIYKDKQIVLPFGKSVDLSVVNVNLLIQFVNLIEFDDGIPENQVKENKLGDQIKTAFETYNKNNRPNLTESNGKMSYTKVFVEGAKINSSTLEDEEFQSLKSIINESFKETTAENVTDNIRKLYSKHENVLLIAKFMNELVQKKQIKLQYSNDGETFVENKAPKNHYAVGIDSIANKLFMDQAALYSESIDTSDKENGFFYNIKYSDRVADLEFNENSKSYIDTTNYLQGFKEIANSNKNSNQELNFAEQWNGVLNLSRTEGTTKFYTSESFLNGSTFISSSSSAGAYSFVQNKYVENKVYKSVKNADVLTVATPTEMGQKNVFMSQGPGLAGFKSNGSNAVEKEKTVAEFLKYITQPKESAYFGLKSNYMPATKKGMMIYENYVNGNFNNDNGKQINKPELEKATKAILKKEEVTQADISGLFSQINKSTGKPYSQASPNAINSGFISDYLSSPDTNDEANTGTILVTSTPNPMGQSIRDSIGSALTGANTITDLNRQASASFKDLIKEDKQAYYSIYRYVMKQNNTDIFSKVNITYKK